MSASRKLRVMELVSGICPNGAVIHALQLSRELAASGHEVTLVCREPLAAAHGPWLHEMLAGQSVELLISDLHRWPLDELRRLCSTACQRRIDVLHSHMSRAHTFGVLMRYLSGIPCVATAHSRHVQLHWALNDFVIANSQATYRFHRWCNGVRRRRMETVNQFVDTQTLAGVTDADCRELRRQLQIDPEAPLVGIIGQVIARKAHHVLVEAWPEVLRQIPSARLLVVGSSDPDYAARVRARAHQLQVERSIIWSEFRTDIPVVMRAIDLCVCCPVEEAFGLTAPEAMAAARPVVATRVGGLPESVVHGETGLLVPPNRPQSLAEAIVRLLADQRLRVRMGLRGQQLVAEQFSLPAQVARTAGILSRVAGLPN